MHARARDRDAGSGRGPGPAGGRRSAPEPRAGLGRASGGTITGGGIVGATGASVPDKDFQAANDACAPILEKAGIHAGSGTIDVTNGTVLGGPVGAGVVGIVVAGGGDITKQAASMKAYAACMRTHGVDVADPVVDEKAGSAQLSFPADPGSAAFRTADAACAVDGFSFAPRSLRRRSASPATRIRHEGALRGPLFSSTLPTGPGAVVMSDP